MTKRNQKRTIKWDGNVYQVKPSKIEIPDLRSMDSLAAILWLNRYTYARGYSTKPNINLRGLSMEVR